jgi:predicted acetyltransferase
VDGFLIADAITYQRLGNIALRYDNGTGDVSYWIAADARGRGAATQALRLLSEWAVATPHLSELRLWTHVDNLGSRTAVRGPATDVTMNVTRTARSRARHGRQSRTCAGYRLRRVKIATVDH